MTDDLNAPLGWEPSPKPKNAGRNGARLTVLLGGLAVATLAGALWRNAATPDASPVVVTLIEPAPPPPLQPTSAAPGPTAALTPSLAMSDAREADVAELASGVRVKRGPEAASTGPRIIHVEPAETGVRLPPAPDPRVAEAGAHGLLPRVSREGLRPMDIYARPFVTSTALRPDAPKIALIVGGVGLSPQGTAAAMAMPEAVTLAFPPYPEDIVALAGRARARGHETLLQAPMEPFDYPRNDPGPHTLVSDRAGKDNNDLHWLMSRFPGYAGIINYLGGRFMADDAALTGTLAEIASRGLYFIDDGEARQSRLTAIAPQLSLPHAVVDQTIDTHGLPQAIDAALAQLELRAREKGAAIGFVNAAPQALERIGRFLAGLEKRGVALAPVSAVLAPGAVTPASPNLARQETKTTMDKQP